MTLMTAHRILISSAVVFFAFFAWWSARQGSGAADPRAAWWALGSALAAVGLALYLASVWKRP